MFIEQQSLNQTKFHNYYVIWKSYLKKNNIEF